MKRETRTQIAPAAGGPASGQAIRAQGNTLSASAPLPIPTGGIIGQSEAEIRLALIEARKRGLRRFDKYPPEEWESPLTPEEQFMARKIG